MTRPYQRHQPRPSVAGGRLTALAEWRRSRLKDAIAALVLAGGALPGRQLATMIEMDPKGLRPLFAGHAFIVAERRSQGDGRRSEAWYRLSLDAIPRAPLPPLVGAPEPGRITA